MLYILYSFLYPQRRGRIISPLLKSVAYLDVPVNQGLRLDPHRCCVLLPDCFCTSATSDAWESPLAGEKHGISWVTPSCPSTDHPRSNDWQHAYPEPHTPGRWEEPDKIWRTPTHAVNTDAQTNSSETSRPWARAAESRHKISELWINDYCWKALPFCGCYYDTLLCK